MLTKRFSRTNREVSRIGFGAMGFAGWFGEQPEAEHIRALHYALDRGASPSSTPPAPMVPPSASWASR